MGEAEKDSENSKWNKVTGYPIYGVFRFFSIYWTGKAVLQAGGGSLVKMHDFCLSVL